MTERPRPFVVPAELAGQRLDRVLAALLPEVSRHRIQKAFAERGVTVDGRERPKSYRPEADARILVCLPAEPPLLARAEDIPLDIIHEDAHLLVVNKPPGLVVHPAPGHHGGTLVNALLHHGRDLADTGDPRRPGIVHRLDQETSGLLVVARTGAAHRAWRPSSRTTRWGGSIWPLGAVARTPVGSREATSAATRRTARAWRCSPRAAAPAVTHYEVIDASAFVCSSAASTSRPGARTRSASTSSISAIRWGDPPPWRRRTGAEHRTRDRAAAAALVRAAPWVSCWTRRCCGCGYPADGRLVTYRAPLASDFAAALAGLRRDLSRSEVGPEAAL
ncbi:MAG: RluA family pseudouridine synthase [Candidatus Krumholzibacteriia bacterium]